MCVVTKLCLNLNLPAIFFLTIYSIDIINCASWDAHNMNCYVYCIYCEELFFFQSEKVLTGSVLDGCVCHKNI